VVTLAAFASRAAALESREPAPKFYAKSLDGERHTLESLKGRPVLIQFWATWCKYCRLDQGAVESIVHDFEKDLVVLAVNMGESKSKVKRYLKDSPRTCRIVLAEDTNLAAMYAARSYPLYILVDREGNIAGRQNGAGGEHSLRKLLQRAGIE